MKAFAYLLLVTLCYFSIAVSAQTVSPPLVRKDVSVPAFSGLAIEGPINVVLVSNQQNPSLPPIQIFGDPKTVSAVTWKIKNHTLYLGTKWTYFPHQGDKLTIRVNIMPAQLTQIDFNSNGRLFGKDLTGTLSLTTQGNGSIELFNHNLNLKSLVTDGKTNISLYGIDSTGLTIQGKNTGKIKLRGKVALNTINLKGDGTLEVYWVNSTDLKINLYDKERVFLAGVAKNLNAHLSDDSKLFAKQMRTDNGKVETIRRANADITVKQHLIALAQDTSIIYYAKSVLVSNILTQNTAMVLSH